MAKKEKVVFQYAPDLEQIDKELAAAMDTLDVNVKQVDDVLRSFAPAAHPAEKPAAKSADATADPSAGSPPAEPVQDARPQ